MKELSKIKILGIDYGASRTGAAVSDLMGSMAHGIETIFSKSAKDVAQKVAALAEKHEVGKIVVGLPKNMNNTLGERGEKTQEFIELLRDTCRCEVVAWDERLTTVSAIGFLNETNTRGKKRKAVIDTVAAEIILQGYLDYIKRGGNKNE